jgi:hypothetical protein
VVNFHEKRATPTVHFLFSPKAQHSDKPFNTVTTPDISGIAPAGNSPEKIKEAKLLVCKVPLSVRGFA